MQGLRTIIGRHRALFALLCVLAFAAKIVLPQGTMLGSSGGALTVMVCAESGSGPSAILIPMKPDAGKDAMAGKAKEACPYSSLGMGALAAADAVLLAASLAFILLLGFAPPASPRPRSSFRVLPPLRGPPLPA